MTETESGHEALVTGLPNIPISAVFDYVSGWH